MESNLYHYKATIVSVYDGDTVTAAISLGFNFHYNEIKLRLYGINAPELRGETLQLGRDSRDYLRGLILGKEVIVETIKDSKGKYGRYLAKIWLLEDEYILVNNLLVSAGHAEYKDY